MLEFTEYNEAYAKKFVITKLAKLENNTTITEDDIIVKKSMRDMFEYLFVDESSTKEDIIEMLLDIAGLVITDEDSYNYYTIQEKMVIEHGSAYATPYGVVHIAK